MSSSKQPIICLMGPTGSGKTAVAVEIVQRFPCEIISVDSAQVYRNMDIGTAKPALDIQEVAPHKLIDICDPKEIYSAGQFRCDALREIQNILSRGKVPLLVGGTMLYFRALQYGLARMPSANAELRTQIHYRAVNEGWESLYAELAAIDATAAKRISSRDHQRIQRALEVYYLTGKAISTWQLEGTENLSQYRFLNLIVNLDDRKELHQRIANRFQNMLRLGFIDEVKKLYERGDLSSHLPSIRSVGYRQAWGYLTGNLTYVDMQDKVIIATRQLAKRQLTWLRSWPDTLWCGQDINFVFQQLNDFLA